MDEDTKLQESEKLVKSTDQSGVDLVKKLKGIMAAFGWVLMAVTSATCVQLLKRSIPDFQLNTMRIGVALVAFSIVLVFKRSIPVISRTEILSTFVFGVLSFLSSMVYFVAVTFVPVSTAQSLHITCGIVFGMILFAVFWTDKITTKRVFCAILCIIGVTLVIQPDFIFTKPVPATAKAQNNDVNITNLHSDYNINNLNGTYLEKINHPVLLALGYTFSGATGLVISCNLLLLKKRPYLNENKFEVLFWSFFTGTLLSSILMVIFERPVLPSSVIETVLVALHVTPNILMWPTTMYAIQYVSGNTFNIVFSTSVVFMLILQYTLLSSILPGNRNWIEVFGVILVLIGSAMESAFETCRTE